MRRREFITLLGGAAAAWSSAARAVAQTTKVYRVGFLNQGDPNADPNRFVASLLAAPRQSVERCQTTT
jgi:hypothetical protein